MPTEPNETHSIEPDVLDEDMTRSDLVFALQHLHFSNRKDGLSTLRLDRGVRDYIVRAIAPAGGRRML